MEFAHYRSYSEIRILTHLLLCSLIVEEGMKVKVVPWESPLLHKRPYTQDVILFSTTRDMNLLEFRGGGGGGMVALELVFS